MKIIHICGPHASGKSTYVKNLILEHQISIDDHVLTLPYNNNRNGLYVKNNVGYFGNHRQLEFMCYKKQLALNDVKMAVAKAKELGVEKLYFNSGVIPGSTPFKLELFNNYPDEYEVEYMQISLKDLIQRLAIRNKNIPTQKFKSEEELLHFAKIAINKFINQQVILQELNCPIRFIPSNSIEDKGGNKDLPMFKPVVNLF